MLTFCLFMTLALFLSSFVLARRSFAAGMVALLGSVAGFGLITLSLVLQAQATVATYTEDCRLMGGCGSDVIQEWCGQSPAACPSIQQIDAN